MCIQLDTVTAVERSHRIAISSRAGLYPRDTVSALLREGRIIERLGARAVPPPGRGLAALRVGARTACSDGVPWHGDVKKRYPGLAERVLDEIRERGPLGSKDFAGKADPAPHRAGTSSEAMWSWKPAKQMLDALFASGELVIAGRVNFQRRYDLPERVLPRTVLDAPVPSRGGGDQGADREGRPGPGRAAASSRSPSTCGRSGATWEARRPRVRTSTRSSPKGSSSGSPSRTARRRSSSRPGSSSTVRGRAPPSSCRRSTTCSGVYQYATRILGFEHVIELYKPAPQRRYGYYVLPFLWRDRIVGRADLKSERKEGALVVKAFHLEPGVRHSKALDEAFERALDRVRRVAGLERVTRADR